MKRIPLLLLLLGMASHWLSAQSNNVSFEAYADAREVLVNTYFDVTFTLKNGEGSNFNPPNFNPFSVMSGPNQGFRTSIVRGQMSQETTITYRLMARQEGTFTISGATIKTGSLTLQAPALSIKVLQGRADGGAGSDDVYLVARLSDTEAYVGQQLTLDYVLYTKVEVESMNPVSESEYQGFFSREIRRFDNRVVREVVNGVQYATRILKRVVLYPQQSGELVIDPYTVTLGVVVGEGRSRSFFYRPDLRRVPASSEELRIQVLPLPGNQPENFSGITGRYIMTVTYNVNKLTTDDALSIKLRLRGEGDLKQVTAPRLELPESFEVFDPKVTLEEYLDFPDRVIGEKEFEYLVVPKEPGTYQLQPEVIIFNPDSARYISLQERRFPIQVRAGTGKGSGLVVDGHQEEKMSGPRSTISLSAATNSGFVGQPVFWGLLFLPVLLFGGLWIYKRRKAIEANIDPALRRRQQARREALKRLTTADAHRQAGDSRNFYDEVERALLGYVGDKLQIPRADMTKANLESRLQELGVETASIERFLGLLRTCEMALYAGKDNAEAMESTYDDAIALLSDVEASMD